MFQTDEAAVDAVRAVLQQYADATFRGDVKRLRDVFHPAASMAGYLGEELLVGTAEPFFADIECHPPMEASEAPYRAEVLEIRASQRTGTAAVFEAGFFGTMSFVNYLHLVLDGDGSWKIISKTFESL